MLLRIPRCLGLVLLVVGLAGCFPEPETPVEEQKNPYYITGMSRVTGRDYKGAIEAFEKAIEVNPRSALAHFELGLLCEQHENDYAAAIYHYNQVIKLRPNGAHPADNARVRIPGCRQEMIKTDLLATVNPAALRESERLREENQQLRKQVESLNDTVRLLRTQPAARPAPSAAGGSTLDGGPIQPPYAASRTTADTLRPRDPGVPAATRPTSSATASSRTHTVKSGENPASIARLYKIRIESLLAANPGLEPKRMRVGQIITVPTS